MQKSELYARGVQQHARSIDGLDISHVEDQNRSLRSSGFITRVAPIVSVQFQTPQPFYGATSLVRTTYDKRGRRANLLIVPCWLDELEM